MSEDKISIAEAIKYLEERSLEIEKYSDKLRESVKTFDDILSEIGKRAGITYTHGEAVYSDEGYGMDFVVALRKHSESRGEWWGLVVDAATGEGGDWLIEASREVLKKFVKQIPNFLLGYRSKLDWASAEYKAVSELAERVAQAIQ